MSLAEAREKHQDLGKYLVMISEQIQQTSELVINQTSEVKTLGSRQAVSGGFQAISLTVLFLYLGILMIRAIIRCVAKKQEAKQEQMLEMMEMSLQERKSKRRAAAKPVPSDK